MGMITVKYAQLQPAKNGPALDLGAANAELERLIRAKVRGEHGGHELELQPSRQLDVRLSSDIAKVKGLKGGVLELVGLAYEELDVAAYALD